MDNSLKAKLQAEYEALDFTPGCNAVVVLKELADKYNISYEELLNNIHL